MDSFLSPLPFLSRTPQIDPTAFVAVSATVIGDVRIGPESSVWYGAVLRGDINRIEIGARSNIQDGAVLHLSAALPCLVGEQVTVGHRAVLHACTVGDQVLVGMGAIILDGSEIGEQCIIGAGALVTQNQKIPAGSLVMGSPARVVRPLTDKEREGLPEWAERYVRILPHYRAMGQDLRAPARAHHPS